MLWDIFRRLWRLAVASSVCVAVYCYTKTALIPLRNRFLSVRSEISAIFLRYFVVKYVPFVCEMKFYRSPFVLTKQYAQVLSARMQTMEKKFPALTFHLTYIGCTELVRNEYSDMFTASLTLDDLFV